MTLTIVDLEGHDLVLFIMLNVCVHTKINNMATLDHMCVVISVLLHLDLDV